MNTGAHNSKCNFWKFKILRFTSIFRCFANSRKIAGFHDLLQVSNVSQIINKFRIPRFPASFWCSVNYRKATISTISSYFSMFRKNIEKRQILRFPRFHAKFSNQLWFLVNLLLLHPDEHFAQIFDELVIRLLRKICCWKSNLILNPCCW